ncbi:GlsB/YeaQ/YmgE family stress response membrane protein [Sphingomonas chungangi]|nr:GlsB/YeaQ/YmgE family stress response membrane protein [Sphingomonas chungangi]
MHTTLSGENMLIAFLIWIIIGAIIGWLAGLLVQGGGFGFIADALIGIFGSVLAGWLFPSLGLEIGHGLIGSVLASVVGAAIVVLVVRLLRRI